jgi:predicted nucleic acid-binding protein
MQIHRAYLDNDIASAITRLDLPEEELDAIEWLIEAHGAGKIVVGTSNHAKREMERTKKLEHREKLKSGLTGLAYFGKDHRYLGSFTLNTGRGSISNPMCDDIVDETMHAELLAAGLETDDAQHLMNAIHYGCDFLLTRDKHFLGRRDALQKKYPIRIRRPSELVNELKAEAAQTAAE